MKPIAILGGTFDPVHNGHLRVALEASDALSVPVRLLPAHVPPHRPPPVASPAQRVAMLRAALAGQDRVQLDTRELDRAEPSFTFDTLHQMRAEFGAQLPLILLLGADAFAGLPSWHRWRELFDLTHIAVLTRPGHSGSLPAELAAVVAVRRTESAGALHASAAGKVLDLPVTPLEISASVIRAMLARGRDPRWLVPDALLADPGLLDVYSHTR
ncbi:MAG: nicotinate-nucleotide adenylyltransferase [Xanthomonadaceae bacterium]|nr:nicotinate-nucleotide adenylyltransferase [Xanthomonadaceae bacterium]MDE1885671.1 nicotinate-nucleotide adenylyltransferase [Xanthomonadaceae bacterium]MDE1960033.1 nicotinate-nucleotide adenylyltransferase [Xanthomonadaceae bacterium]MDE2084092.1 nicotinate-nucleotide adenylyltransferase [Xanthomonadaceae bacterium]